MKFTFAPETRPLAGYTIKRAIDRGGFGEVYYALSDAGKEVALKLLQRNQQVELRGVSQCLNLKHPNLVTIFDIRTDEEGDHWVVMEYMSGKSLEQVLADHPHGLPPHEIEAWLSGLAAGITFLHDRGVVHRDLKPANVFRENGVVKIGDVGLSKYITPSRRSAQTESVGTVYYMAPEVAHGKYGSELDVYSLAVMTYEMLTGRVPFNGESTAEILMKHLTEPPALSPLPADLRPVLARALEKDPLRRTPSAGQFAAEFQNALHGSPWIEEPKVRPDREPSRKEHVYPVHGAERHDYSRQRAAALGAKHDLKAVKLVGFAAVVVVGVCVLTSRHGFNPIRSLPMLAICGALSYAAYCFLLFFIRTTREAFVAVGPTAPPQPLARPRPTIAPQAPAAARAVAPPQVVRAPRQTASVPTPLSLRPMTSRQRLADLTGSMAVATVWSLIASAGVAVMTSLFSHSAGGPADPGLFGVFALTTIVGSWVVLFTSKCTEGLAVEEPTRRLILTVFGLGVGAFAFWLDRTLLVQLPDHDSYVIPHVDGLIHSIGRYPLLTAENQPTLVGYAMFFAALFGLRRWWWHADAYRPRRFRLRSLLLTCVAGLAVPAAFAFPQDWGLCWAAAMCCVVQLSARWVPKKQRQALAAG